LALEKNFKTFFLFSDPLVLSLIIRIWIKKVLFLHVNAGLDNDTAVFLISLFPMISSVM
jgi:hypothetical protein